MNEIAHLPQDPADLGQKCCQQNDLFRRRGVSDERYCLELFRRALEEGRQSAWDWVYRCHQQQVANAIRFHRNLGGCDEEEEDLIQQAFAKFARFAHYQPPLPAMLAYLRACADSVVIDCARRRQLALFPLGELYHDPPAGPAQGGDPAAEIETELQADLLWRTVLGFAQDETERLVAFFSLHQGLKPSEIQARFSSLFDSPAAISQIRDNFMRRLKRNRDLLEPLLDDRNGVVEAYKPTDTDGGD